MTETLTIAQRRRAEQFADLLVEVGPRNADDLRGVLLCEVAKALEHRAQFYTARVIQHAADVYEGKR